MAACRNTKDYENEDLTAGQRYVNAFPSHTSWTEDGYGRARPQRAPETPFCTALGENAPPFCREGSFVGAAFDDNVLTALRGARPDQVEVVYKGFDKDYDSFSAMPHFYHTPGASGSNPGGGSTPTEHRDERERQRTGGYALSDSRARACHGLWESGSCYPTVAELQSAGDAAPEPTLAPAPSPAVDPEPAPAPSPPPSMGGLPVFGTVTYSPVTYSAVTYPGHAQLGPMTSSSDAAPEPTHAPAPSPAFDPEPAPAPSPPPSMGGPFVTYSPVTSSAVTYPGHAQLGPVTSSPDAAPEPTHAPAPSPAFDPAFDPEPAPAPSPPPSMGGPFVTYSPVTYSAVTYPGHAQLGPLTSSSDAAPEPTHV